VVDVGTDHAQLPIWLVEQGRVERALAVDVADGPLSQARKQAAAWAPSVEVRQSDGLAGIEPGEVDCVTICGMGGLTVARILSSAQDVLAHVRRVVVQPQGMAREVRSVLLSMGWGCVQACLVAEKKHLYVVESWELSPEEPDWDAADRRWGRLIRRSPDPLYRSWIGREIDAIDQGLERLTHAGQGAHRDAIQLNEDRARLVRELSLIGD